MSGKSEIVKDVLETASDAGKIMSYIQFFGGVFIGAALIIAGVYLIFKDTSNYGKTLAKIVQATCWPANANRTSYNCALNLVYNIDGREYNAQLSTNDKLYNRDELIEITYNKTNPVNMEKYIDYKKIGWILIGIGSFLILMVSVIAYFSSRNKAFAILQLFKT